MAETRVAGLRHSCFTRILPGGWAVCRCRPPDRQSLPNRAFRGV